MDNSKYIIGAAGRQRRVRSNALGQAVESWEYDDASTSLAVIAYSYDVAGNLTRTTKLIPGGGEITKTVATYSYDRLGRQLTANDPDLGLVESTWNSLSELLSQQSPRLREHSSTLVQAFDYDLLGRVVELSRPNVQTDFE